MTAKTFNTLELCIAAIARLSEGDRMRVLRFAEFVLESRQGKRLNRKKRHTPNGETDDPPLN